MQCYKKTGQGLTCPVQHTHVLFVYFKRAFKKVIVLA